MFALLPSSSLFFSVLLAEALKATWLKKLSCLCIKTYILSGFQVVLIDIVYQVIFVSLFKIHKTKCTPRDSNINQIIYMQSFPKCLEVQAEHLEENDKCFAGFIFFFLYQTWNYFERKKDSTMDISILKW